MRHKHLPGGTSGAALTPEQFAAFRRPFRGHSNLPAQDRRAVVWSAAETQAQLGVVQDLLLEHLSRAHILTRLREQWPLMSLRRCTTLILRVEQSWTSDGEARRAGDRAAAIARFRQLILRARVDFAVPVYPAPHPNAGQPSCSPEHAARLNVSKHNKVLSYEQEIAKLQGTYAPEKHEHDLTASVASLNVFTNLTPDQVATYQARHSALVAKAFEYDAVSAPKKKGSR